MSGRYLLVLMAMDRVNISPAYKGPWVWMNHQTKDTVKDGIGTPGKQM